MRKIIMSIRPQWVAKILNGEKTLEIRTTAPKEWKDYLSGKTDKKPEPIEVFIYCTKGKYEMGKFRSDNLYHEIRDDCCYAGGWTRGLPTEMLNGKVVAKFTLNKIEEIRPLMCGNFYHKEMCLTTNELNEYLNNKTGYAWHIDNLVILDKPKELSEFMKTLDNFDGLNCFRCLKYHSCSFNRDKKCEKLKLTRAPQSWCYIEV